VNQILQYGRVMRPSLGVVIAPPQALQRTGFKGVLVLDVSNNSELTQVQCQLGQTQIARLNIAKTIRICVAVVMRPCFTSAMSFVWCRFFGVCADVTHIQSTALD
jgi:hypothetical protein